MLKSLRLRLSLLYLAASLGLVGLLGTSTYGLLALYFQNSTDLALQYKMAIEFRARGYSLPNALAEAEQDWSQGSSRGGISTPQPVLSSESEEDEENEGFPQAYPTGVPYGENDERYDGDLAPVFVLPVEGETPVSGVPAVQDPAAITHALQTGSDLRTIRLEDGVRVRLLTYSIGEGGVLQVGRLLGDQQRMLSQYLTGMFILGSIASLVMALASWILAGRSIKPAQRAWDQQQQFISNASHELRTPLTLLRASAEYALRSPTAAERENSLRDIVDECDYMNRLVEDLLLLSRLDAHRLVLEVTPIPLAELLGETTRQVEKVAAAQGVDLILETVEGTVRGDRIRLRQVLLILLDNALRFTPAGKTIRLGSQARGREVVLSVIDGGVGIAPEHLPHLFERFYQVPGQPQEGRGNGLGLSIARALVEAQHGRITISSQPGQGTHVQIHLPAA